MVNPRKGKMCKMVWFKPGEYERLINAIEGNFNDEVLDIIFNIKLRGDFE